MALIGNNSILNRNANRQFTGGAASGYYGAFNPANAQKNRYSQFAFYDWTSTPNAYRENMAWVMPIKPGGMSSKYQSYPTLTKSTATLVNAQYMTATGNLVLSVGLANLGQLAPATATGNLSLTKVSATLGGSFAGSATANLSLTKVTASMGGKFPGSGIANLSLSGSCIAHALGQCSGTAGGPEPLSAAGLAQALLDNNDIETGYSMRNSLRLVLASLAGKLSGAGTSTIAIRDINDAVDRIVATVDSNGNRTAVTKDLT